MSHKRQGQGYAGCLRVKGPHQVSKWVPLAVAAKAVELYTSGRYVSARGQRKMKVTSSQQSYLCVMTNAAAESTHFVGSYQSYEDRI